MRTVALAAGESFAALFPVVDPIGNAPTFAALTSRLDAREKRREALKSAAIMAAILVAFLLAGEPLLRFFHISLEALQIAGGLVIAACGFQMVMAVALPDPAELEAKGADQSVSFSPMAMPLLAGPGALGIVMGLEASQSDILVIPGYAIGIIAMAALTYGCLVASGLLTRFLGPAGVDAVVRVMGLLVLAIGIELIVHGILAHGAVVALNSPS
jgi:multiple antibiotic resistance protein